MPRKNAAPEATISEREVAEHWDHNADSWSERVRAGMDVYREFYNNPAFLAFITTSFNTSSARSQLARSTSQCVTMRTE